MLKRLGLGLLALFVVGSAEAQPLRGISQTVGVCDPAYSARCIKPAADGSIAVTGTVTATSGATATAAAPSYSEGTSNPLSQTLAGALRTIQPGVTGTKAPGTAATTSLLNGAVYTAAGITLTDGQQAALQFDSSGRLITADAIGATAALQSSVQGSFGAETANKSVIYDSSGVAVDWAATSPFNLSQVAGASVATGNGTAAGAIRVALPTDGTGVLQPVPGTTGGCTLSGTQSAASTNATNIKASAGKLCGGVTINTTATLYYLRLYNLASAPTCSSATGFVATFPIPASATGAGTLIDLGAYGVNFSTGIGFCLTGGGSSTDNTNAATGVYINLAYN